MGQSQRDSGLWGGVGRGRGRGQIIGDWGSGSGSGVGLTGEEGGGDQKSCIQQCVSLHGLHQWLMLMAFIDARGCYIDEIGPQSL